ncbi:MAG TPA: amino acid adenylation domain-containing protein [Umezawaea sp.]|nr:amino acid adenylation domain-containing protein [Umezawaea sp.]
MHTKDFWSAHDRFSARAAARGDAVALMHGHERITYRQLDERADRLARHLLGLGLGRGAVVVVHLDRSAELVVSMLAVFKAGLTYLPADPAWPADRLSTVVRDSGCRVVISRRADPGVPTIDPGAGVADPPDFAGPAVAPGDIAYVIYTSGSTGKPRGVRVEHYSLAYLLDRINERYGVTPDDRVLQFASITTDTAIEQVLNTLLAGAVLVLPDDSVAPSELPEVLRANGITVMDLTPPFWRAFLAALPAGPVDLPVRLTIVGGSAVHAEDCRTALRLMPGARLVNAYGLTETTITSCTMEITPEVLPAHGPAPVGRPLAGTSVSVVDDRLRPLGVGRTGEVVIGGPAVAAGYVAPRPSEQSRFSFRGNAVRTFRTGDTGRLGLDGVLEVIGRVDRQFKVRGFRVEPGEVEAALTEHAEVRDAVVAPFVRGGEQEMAACYTTSGTGVTASELRSHLAERLPAPLIPAVFVEVDELPVTPAGKVDLAALPIGGPDAVEAGAEEPSGLVEHAVAALWRQVLGVRHVGPADNFFALGGNSILAAELLAKVRTALGILITQVRPLIRMLLDDSTLRGFAEAVSSARAGTLAGDGGQVDFTADAAVDGLVTAHPVDVPNWQRPAHVLLTGATGFVGVYLLRELLRTTDATVHCLVRADSRRGALRRIQANARHYFQDDLGRYTASGRVQAVPGDLAEPLLGLSEEDFDALARVVDVVHHPGGAVNFIYPYSHLRPANVDGVREVVRLAGRYRNAPVHYISTMAVVSGFGTAGVRYVSEHTPAAHVDRLSVGYVESKWVAEALLRNASDAGLPVAIYRAADVSGDCATGAWNTATEMCAMKRFIVDTGMSPVAELPLDYTPVDRYVAAVAHIAATKPPRGEVYHLTNPAKVNVSVLADRLRARGHQIRDVSWERWVEEIVRVAVEQPGHPMTPFAPLFIDRCATGEMSVAEMYLETTFPEFSRTNVETALRGSGIEIPPVDAVALDRYIDYLTAVDFLPKPA